MLDELVGDDGHPAATYARGVRGARIPACALVLALLLHAMQACRSACLYVHAFACVLASVRVHTRMRVRARMLVRACSCGRARARSMRVRARVFVCACGASICPSARVHARVRPRVRVHTCVHAC